MQRGLIDYDVKIIVLRVLKQKICDEFGRSHGDIKEILIHYRKSEDNLIVIQLNLQNQEIAREYSRRLQRDRRHSDIILFSLCLGRLGLLYWWGILRRYTPLRWTTVI